MAISKMTKITDVASRCIFYPEDDKYGTLKCIFYPEYDEDVISRCIFHPDDDENVTSRCIFYPEDDMLLYSFSKILSRL